MSDTLPPLPNPFVSFSPVSAMVYLGPGDYYTAEHMRSYALAAVEMERERCARVCEKVASDGTMLGGEDAHALVCAEAIRATLPT